MGMTVGDAAVAGVVDTEGAVFAPLAGVLLFFRTLCVLSAVVLAFRLVFRFELVLAAGFAVEF
jgi:hypothetical protein